GLGAWGPAGAPGAGREEKRERGGGRGWGGGRSGVWSPASGGHLRRWAGHRRRRR
ncbi:hypothetical protein TIFTF001_056823, partial [Ficus carica]